MRTALQNKVAEQNSEKDSLPSVQTAFRWQIQTETYSSGVSSESAASSDESMPNCLSVADTPTRRI